MIYFSHILLSVFSFQQLSSLTIFLYIVAMKGKQGVMWPRSVARKIWKRWDSNNFVTDFPSIPEALVEDPRSNQEHSSPRKVFKNPKDTKKFKVFVNTWNVGGVTPPLDLDMEELLETRNNACDIYVLGFQEVVPLNTGNVLGVEKNRISMEWNSLIRTALNKKTCASDEDEETKVYPFKNGSFSMNDMFSSNFRCIVSKNMVGIFLSVWIRSDLQQYIKHASVSCVGCGIMGCLGNKGAISVRFFLHGTSFCFVCGHLASGGKQGDEKRRNSDAIDILSRTSFPSGSNELPRKILDHDRVIFLGDLNYRISLPEAQTRTLIHNKEWSFLLENDQLRVELMEGKVFEGWHEETIKFSPTYKYYPNSDVYYGCVHQMKKGEKKRAPAWCDRILWYGKGLKQKQYNRCEIRLSDHRPVWAIFEAEVKGVRKSREFRNFFLSDRFDRIPNILELYSQEDFVCNGRSSFQM